MVKQAIGIKGEVTDLGVANVEVAKSDETFSREGIVVHSLCKVLCILHWNNRLVADDGDPDGKLEPAADSMRNKLSDMGFCHADKEVLHRSLHLCAIIGIQDNPNADTNQAIQNLLGHGEQLVNGQIVGDGLCCEDEWWNFHEGTIVTAGNAYDEPEINGIQDIVDAPLLPCHCQSCSAESHSSP